MMLQALRGSLRGLGEDVYDDEGNWIGDTSDIISDTPVLAPYPTTPIATIESPISGVLNPTALNPITPPATYGQGQTYDQYLATQVKNAQTQLDATNATLKSLMAGGASIAQIAAAQSSANSAAATAAQVKAQQTAQLAAKLNPTSGCSSTLMPGVCDTYVYIGGVAAAGLILMLAMKGGR